MMRLDKPDEVVFVLGAALVYVGSALVGLCLGNLVGRLVHVSVERLHGSKVPS